MTELFHFKGRIQTSKSQLLRALLLKFYRPDLEIDGDSNCDDVLVMNAALEDYLSGKREIHCGESGLALRLLTAFFSRKPEEWKLTGTDRLLSRPMQDLIEPLEQLGPRVRHEGTHICVDGKNWTAPKGGLDVQTSLSSQ